MVSALAVGLLSWDFLCRRRFSWSGEGPGWRSNVWQVCVCVYSTAQHTEWTASADEEHRIRALRENRTKYYHWLWFRKGGITQETKSTPWRLLRRFRTTPWSESSSDREPEGSFMSVSPCQFFLHELQMYRAESRAWSFSSFVSRVDSVQFSFIDMKKHGQWWYKM